MFRHRHEGLVGRQAPRVNPIRYLLWARPALTCQAARVNTVHMSDDAEGTKARLLTEARDLYLEDGFARFSLREVARRVGISAPAVYRHYNSKEALLAEV